MNEWVNFYKKNKRRGDKPAPGAVVVAAKKFTSGTAQELVNWQKREDEMYNRIKSYFQNAVGGTIILKNIQLINFEKQSAFLHILSEEHPDVRMICTANGTLMKMLAEEDFSDNLFYMLRQSSITVPPLREMTEDIPDSGINQDYKRWGIICTTIKMVYSSISGTISSLATCKGRK